MVRKIFGPKEDDVTGVDKLGKKLHNFTLHQILLR
jgi:hypothetical protein